MRSPLLFILIICLLQVLQASGQETYLVSGRVVDSRTREPLAFVNIVIHNTNNGGTSDIDGKFRIKSSKPVQSIRLSYVGYEPKTVVTSGRTTDLLIQLNSKEIDLSEVEILPGVNPAHRIIRNVIENRELNDPEKVKTFSYTAYDKTVFTAALDTTLNDDFSALVDTSGVPSLPGMDVGFDVRTDTAATDSARQDSTTRFLEKLISEQYLFLMENVSKRKFMAPDKNYNQVIATKMSGFKDPLLVFLTTQIQSFSFYKPIITIFQKDYINPIGSGGLNKYFFKLEDTTYYGKDTVFIISFRPIKGTNFDGLKGLFAINTNHWAIQNVSAEPYPNTGGFSIRIHHLYEFIDGIQWFPVQLNSDVSFNRLSVGGYKIVGSGRSYIRDIVLNPELVRREFSHLDVEVEPGATTRSENFWNQYRTDSLTIKDRQTYKVLDSVGKANNFDKMAKTLQTVLTGKIPWGPVDFDLGRILNYNTYEGLIAGIGLHTNDKVSRWFRIGGFYQYAFAISTSKYGGDVKFTVNRRHDVTISGSYFYDLIESGGVSYPNDYESILSGNFAPLLLKKLDRTESFNFSLGFRALKFVLFNLGYTNERKRTTTYDFATQEGNAVILQDNFQFSNITAGFKWAYGEKFIQTVNNKISFGTKYPVVWLQYTRGLKGFLGGEFDYNRADLKIRKTFKIKFLGKLTLQVNGGYIDNPVPACNLFYAPGSYRLFTVYAPYTFSTMHSNEFLSNKYASLFIYHDFGYLLFKGKKWFHPEFALSQNIGFGWLDDPERYAYNSINPREMNLGYYESGLLINNLVNLRVYTVGIGAYYRWGPYSFDNVSDNFAYKISLIFPF